MLLKFFDGRYKFFRIQSHKCWKLSMLGNNKIFMKMDIKLMTWKLMQNQV